MTLNRPAALIVEDQPFVGLVASDILRESGFDIFHAFDSDAAFAVLAEHPEIQVVVAEAKLPGEVDGLELCRKLSRDRPDVQLVVTTAGAVSPAEMPRGARMLHKPFASGELRQLVRARELVTES